MISLDYKLYEHRGQPLLTKNFVPNFQIFIFKDLAVFKSNTLYLVTCEVVFIANRIEKLSLGLLMR